MVFLEDTAKNRHFQNLNRRANARKKTRKNDILVTSCIYKKRPTFNGHVPPGGASLS